MGTEGTRCAMTLRRLLLGFLTFGVGIFVVVRIHQAALENQAAVCDQQPVESEFWTDKHEVLEEENKTYVSVNHCLQLNIELEPFNLLMALNQSDYTVADFTTLNIEEIRHCLNFLEIFQQKVSCLFFLLHDVFRLS
jgi:hypothetical protein